MYFSLNCCKINTFYTNILINSQIMSFFKNSKDYLQTTKYYSQCLCVSVFIKKR